MEKEKRERIDAIRKSIIRKKYISIVLALFTLGVNIFAWFAFSANASLKLDATIAQWEIEFEEEGVTTHDVVIDITKMKPGMDNYSKTVTVYNYSDVVADFSYEITSIKLLGYTVAAGDPKTYMRTHYPFKVTFTPSANYIGIDQYISFDALVTWSFDTQTPEYYQMNDSIYQYDSGFVYYINSGGAYTETTVANTSAFNSNRNNLYIQKDDADTFFGMKCAQYETNTGLPCLSLTLRLKAEQQMG